MDTEFLTNNIQEHLEGHLVPSKQSQDAFREIWNIIQPKRILEIGFNAGHSAYMTLDMLPDVTYCSVDIATHRYTVPNADKIKALYPERFAFKKADSKRLIASTLKDFDVIFIDGDHSIKGLGSDLKLARDAKIPYILVDDYMDKWFPAIIELTEHHLTKDDFPYTMVGVYTYESRDGDNAVALLKRDDTP